MTRTLADLRADSARGDKPKARSERAYTICLRPDLVSEVESLTTELTPIEELLAELEVEKTPRNEDGEQAKPRKAVDRGEPTPEMVDLQSQADAIRTRLEQVIEEMAEHEGELKVRANLTDGEWRRWCTEHPARKEDDSTSAYHRDLRLVRGYCNSDDLLDELGKFAQSWNGEALGDGDWASVLEPNISGGDKAMLVGLVVEMYEARTDFRQLRSNFLTALKRSSGSDSASVSGSPTSDSMAGSPAPSSAATT